jgi:ABC-type proline/glycine betaine transport system permease subunit
MDQRSHEVARAVSELHHLEDVAEAGESNETPLVLFGAVWVACAMAVVVLVAIGFLAYWLASR